MRDAEAEGGTERIWSVLRGLSEELMEGRKTQQRVGGAAGKILEKVKMVGGNVSRNGT